MYLIATIILAVEATKMVVSYRLTPLSVLAVGPAILFLPCTISPLFIPAVKPPNLFYHVLVILRVIYS